MNNLMDYCEAWIRGYVAENDIDAPEDKIEHAIITMHSYLCRAVDGYMIDCDLISYQRPGV